MANAIISKALSRLWTALTPTRRKAVIHPRFDHSPIAQTLDVDRLHGILRAAEDGNTTELFGLYMEIVTGDAHVLTEFGKRKLALLGDTESVQPRHPKEPADEAAAELCEALTEHRDWLDAMKWLLDSTIFPVSVLEKVYKPSIKPGLRFELASLKGVPYRLLDYTCGRLRIENTDEHGMPLGTYHEPDPVRYIVHRGHLLTTPDRWGGPMRALLFWWLFATMDRDWWIRFIERYGAPFMVGKFDKGDDDSRSILMSAFSAASKVLGLVITRETEVEVHQVSDTNAGEVFSKFHEYAQAQISKLIVGQTLSSETKAQGLGSGASALHGQVRQDIRQWDNKVTGNTVRTQLFADYLAINGLPGHPPTIQWGGETADDNKTTAEVVKIYSEAGLRVKDESIPVLNQRLGLELERAESPTPATPGAPAGPSDAMAKLRQAIMPGTTTFAASLEGLSADPRDVVAQVAAANLSRAFRGRFAPVAQMIRESTSAADLEARITAFAAGAGMEEPTRLLEEALVAYVANGAVAASPP